MRLLKFSIPLIILSFLVSSFYQSKKDPWQQKQLMEAAALAELILEEKTDDIYIYSIGPSAVIKNSVDMGAAREKANLEAFGKRLKSLPKDAEIVIYCGCCPFNKCPNVRPAFGLLNDMGFTNHKLLNLPKNVKTDWIDKGYPLLD